MELYFDQGVMDAFMASLVSEDKSKNTMVKYAHDLAGFMQWLDGRPITQDELVAYKHYLVGSGKAPSSINSILSAVNKLLAFMGRADLKISFLKIQRRVFRDNDRDLTRADYDKLVETAYANGRLRLALVLETIGSTGIRISELHYVTYEALKERQVDINLKNKLRTIMLSKKLCDKLRAYCKDQGIASGEIFRTRAGNPLSRQQIWREMKSLCEQAGIPDSKVYPHNFRHMFATVFYSSCKDIVKLADVLGHSSINTTRIYLISSGREHARQLEKLNLVK